MIGVFNHLRNAQMFRFAHFQFWWADPMQLNHPIESSEKSSSKPPHFLGVQIVNFHRLYLYFLKKHNIFPIQDMGTLLDKKK